LTKIRNNSRGTHVFFAKSPLCNQSYCRVVLKTVLLPHQLKTEQDER